MTRSLYWRGFAWLGFAALHPLAIAATVEGQVRDAHGTTVSHADVAIEGDTFQTVRVKTDAKGHYQISALPAGKYRLHADAQHTEALVLQQNESKLVDLTVEAPAASVEFFDTPTFTVAGVTDNTYLGGHGSDTVTRSKVDLAKAAASLDKNSAVVPHASRKSLTSLLEHEPENASLHSSMANLEEESGHPLQALHEFERAAELQPNETHIYDWGTELLVHGAPAAALEIFNKGIPRFPQSSRMRLAAAAALYAQGNYAEAAHRFFEATDLNPSEPAPYLFLAKVQAPLIAESTGFVARMARFVKLQPDNPWAHYYYAVSLWRTRTDPQDKQTLPRVEALLQDALRLDPKMASAYLQMGILNSEQQDLPSAIRNYQAAIQLAPEMQEPHYRLAQAYRQVGSTQKALKEAALFQKLSNTSSEKTDRERSEMQKFVVTLRTR